MQVLIKVTAASICGSDTALYKWDAIARVIATIPFIPGHECAGVVVKAGPQANLQVGYSSINDGCRIEYFEC